jgi:CheY-like chemotaxis protein
MPITLQLAGKTKPAAAAGSQEKEKSAFAGAGPTPTPPAVAQVGRNRSILVVDDNPVVLKAFEMKLKACGFAVSTTTNCNSVVSAAETARAQLIILDIRFEAGSGVEWSGFTILQWLRRFPELARMPIIFVSGNDASLYREKALAAGAVAFFQKPVNFDELLDVIVRSLDGYVPASLAMTSTVTETGE